MLVRGCINCLDIFPRIYAMNGSSLRLAMLRCFMQYYILARSISSYSKVERILYLIRGELAEAKDTYKIGLSTDGGTIAALSCVVSGGSHLCFGIKLLVCIELMSTDISLRQTRVTRIHGITIAIVFNR